MVVDEPEKKQAAGEEEMPSFDSSKGGGTSDDEDDHMTVAQVLISPLTPARKSATFSSNKSKLKRERLLRVNNARFASKSRNNYLGRFRTKKCRTYSSNNYDKS